MNKLSILLLLATCPFIYSNAQFDPPAPMRVMHCSAVNQQTAVQNIYVDEDNTKWIGTSNGLYRLYSADNSSKVALDPDSWYLLRQRRGDGVLQLSKTVFDSLNIEQSFTSREGTNRINTTCYDKGGRTLWIGTTNSGIYRYRYSKGKATLVEQLTMENSKLKSNQINTIFRDKFDRIWFGTEAGVLLLENNTWKLYEKKERIVAISAIGPDVWIMGDGFLYKVDPGNRWMPGDVDPRLAKGKIKDISFDSEGRLWVASEVITRYDIVENEVEIFDAARGFVSKNVNCIVADQDNALWIGTYDKGLFVIEKKASLSVSCEIEKGLSCDGSDKDAALKAKAFGGTKPYRFKWNIDYEGDNPTGLGPGTYAVTVTDATGKERKTSALIEGKEMTASAALDKDELGAGGQNGQATVYVNGGTPDYTFQWDNGERNATAVKLSEGLHSVTITDRVGCVKEVEVTVGLLIVEEPEPEPVVMDSLLVEIIPIGELNCHSDVNIKLGCKVSKGQSPYTYNWSLENCVKGHCTDVGAGYHTVTVTDVKGAVGVAGIKLDAPVAEKYNVKVIEPASSPTLNDGKARVSVAGKVEDYTFRWDNGETKVLARKLGAGTHWVEIVNSAGCAAKIMDIEVKTKLVPGLSADAVTSGQTIRLEKLFFEADSSRITDISKPILDELYSFLKENRKIVIEVGGHTNNLPEHSYCDRLSTARASAVAGYIVQKGIEPERVSYKGYGKRKPIATNRTRQGRSQNQRVEVKILSVGG